MEDLNIKYNISYEEIFFEESYDTSFFLTGIIWTSQEQLGVRKQIYGEKSS